MATTSSSESEDDYSTSEDENSPDSKSEGYVPYVAPTPKKEADWDFAKQYETEIGSASEQNTSLIKKAAVALKIMTIIITFSARFVIRSCFQRINHSHGK